MHSLSILGFGPFFENQLTPAKSAIGRIAVEHRGRYEAWSDAGAGPARLAGALARELSGEAFPGVGDWVVLDQPPAPDRTAVIERVLDRRTVFIRGAAGRESRGQVIAANIDVVFIVCGLDNDFNLHRIERYLARVYASGAAPVVVLNKADVCDEAEARRAEVEAVSIGVEVVLASALRDEGLDEIRSRLPAGTTAALVGSSGAGKSTIINRLLGEEKMATGGLRRGDGKGRHTTTHRQLMVLPGHGLLIDTPGMRELQLFDEEGIGDVFADIEKIAARCRYRDCSHGSEPGCAVRLAAETGELAADRLEHYQKLMKEARANELRHDEHQRRKSERVWGQLHAEVHRMKKWKRGE